eukprot:31285-Pelagococcus_subviridis.AAC.9
MIRANDDVVNEPRARSVSLLLRRLERRLRRGETRDGNAERRARDVVQPFLVEKLHGRRVAAVLAADANLQIRVRASAFVHAHLDQRTDALLDALLEVRGKELRDVVSRVPERHLRQVVRPEREKLGAAFASDLIREQRRARNLNHRPDAVLHGHARLLEHRRRDLANHSRLVLKLRDGPDERDHDVRFDNHAVFLRRARGFENRPRLHPTNLRIRDREPAPAEAEHRVYLRELLDSLDDLVLVRARVRGEQSDDLVELAVWKKLVQRRIEQPNRDRHSVHRAKDPVKVAPLERQQIVQRRLAIARQRRHDHPSHGAYALARAEEHVLGAHEPYALRAVDACRRRVLRRVRVGEHAQRPKLVHPGHEDVEVAADRGRRELRLAADDLAGRAVQRQPVALVELDAAQRQPPVLFVDDELAASGHARLSPPARDDGGVRGHPAARGEDSLRGVHPADVLRRHDLPDRRAGRRGKADADDVRGVPSLVLELRVKQLIHVRRLHERHRGRSVDHPGLDEVDRDLHRAGAGALPAPRLQHVQLALLDRELDVLHVFVVLLEELRVSNQVVVRLRERVLHREDVLRRSNPRDDVLPLRVDEVLAVQKVLARARVPREAHARAAGVSHVPEHHRLDVHRGALQPDDAVDGHVLLRAVAVPAVVGRSIQK